ncbi:hypothetical protein B6S12_09620 [Helicobacter valdiviensis]|uniref:Uncharacterized protein n=2 Tax=Helicobacter valdiviensis TaxID=1458358 RepID=A0A2W6PKZ7_9HELI|nr:hypothetical protein B6S12_09620 [Helicobacter valdiviensis]
MKIFFKSFLLLMVIFLLLGCEKEDINTKQALLLITQEVYINFPKNDNQELKPFFDDLNKHLELLNIAYQFYANEVLGQKEAFPLKSYFQYNLKIVAFLRPITLPNTLHLETKNVKMWEHFFKGLDELTKALISKGDFRQTYFLNTLDIFAKGVYIETPQIEYLQAYLGTLLLYKQDAIPSLQKQINDEANTLLNKNKELLLSANYNYFKKAFSFIKDNAKENLYNPLQNSRYIPFVSELAFLFLGIMFLSLGILKFKKIPNTQNNNQQYTKNLTSPHLLQTKSTKQLLKSYFASLMLLIFNLFIMVVGFKLKTSDIFAQVLLGYFLLFSSGIYLLSLDWLNKKD